MAELEARVGTQLLQRTTRRLGLTAAGERLLARAPEWLDELDDMVGELREARRGLSGTLRISAPVTFGEMVVEELLRRFRTPYPDLVIDLRLSDRFVDLAAEGIDLAIRIGKLDNSALLARRLAKTTLLLVASPQYLAKRGRPQMIGELAGHDFIRDTNMRGDGAWPLSEGKKLHRISVSGHFMVNSARLTRSLAIDGEGIAFCPDYVVRDDLAAGRLEHVLPDVHGPQLDIHAVYLGKRRLARRSRALLDYLVKNLQAGLPEDVG